MTKIDDEWKRKVKEELAKSVKENGMKETVEAIDEAFKLFDGVRVTLCDND